MVRLFQTISVMLPRASLGQNSEAAYLTSSKRLLSDGNSSMMATCAVMGCPFFKWCGKTTILTGFSDALLKFHGALHHPSEGAG